MPPNEPVPGQPAVSGGPSPVASQPTVAPTAPSATNKLLVVIGLAVLVVAIGLGAFFAFHSTKKAATASVTTIKKIAPAQVSITSSGFVPATMSVKLGQAVTWTNKDSAPHWVASDPYPTDNNLSGFNAKQAVTYNGSFSFIFNKVGTYTYHDQLNPYTLKGTIVVNK